MSSRLLLKTRVLTVAAPFYLERNGRPTTPEDLARHDCIHYVDPQRGEPFEAPEPKPSHGADRVARRLSKAGFAAAPIHGDRSQSQRNSALRGFAEGRHRVLVATDVVARGIDVADVAHVVNFDLPREAEDFVHRVGRTGRAANHGVASTFAAPDETHAFKKLERTLAMNTKKYRVRPNPAACRQVSRSVIASDLFRL